MQIKNVFSGRVIFDHLPKTAGQAINLFLSETLGNGSVTTNLIGKHHDLLRQYGGLYPVISAHIEFQNGEGLDPRYQYITLLREPIDRVISWLYFLMNNHDETQIPELREAAKRFVESNGEDFSNAFVGSISNFYVEHFCRIIGSGFENDKEKIKNSLNAISNYKVVGFYHNMQQFLSDMGNLIGISTPANIKRVNPTAQRPHVEHIPSLLRERIRELNFLDLQLYNQLLSQYTAVPEHQSNAYVKQFDQNWDKYRLPRNRVFTTPDLTILSANLREGHDILHGQLVTFDVHFFVARELTNLEMGIHIFDIWSKQYSARTIFSNTASWVLPRKLFSYR